MSFVLWLCAFIVAARAVIWFIHYKDDCEAERMAEARLRRTGKTRAQSLEDSRANVWPD